MSADLLSLEIMPLVALILFTASVIQGAVGFAYALFALPFLAWLGLDLAVIVPLMVSSVIAQLLVGVTKLRGDIQWKPLVSGTVIRYLTVPLGILALSIISVTLDKDQIKQIIGVLILATVVVQTTVRPSPRERLHPGWSFLAFSTSGFMAGLVSVGGPPIVLWVMAHDWTNRQMRSFLFASFLSTAPLNAALLYLAFGEPVIAPMIAGLALSPLVALGSNIGVRLGHVLSVSRLRNVALGILAIMALASIAAPLLN